MPVTPVTLEGRHVRLEPLSMNHLGLLCEIGFDPELWRVGLSVIGSQNDMKSYIATALQWQAEGTALPFVTIERPSGTVVGSTRFANIDRTHRRVEIGWTWIARPWQRTPLNTEAKYLMLTHAFETLGCIRVELKTDSLNEKSRNAMLRIGAKEEGTLRNHMITQGGRIRHTVYFSVTNDEWPCIKRPLEEKLARPFTRPA